MHSKNLGECDTKYSQTGIQWHSVYAQCSVCIDVDLGQSICVYLMLMMMMIITNNNLMKSKLFFSSSFHYIVSACVCLKTVQKPHLISFKLVDWSCTTQFNCARAHVYIFHLFLIAHWITTCFICDKEKWNLVRWTNNARIHTCMSNFFTKRFIW